MNGPRADIRLARVGDLRAVAAVGRSSAVLFRGTHMAEIAQDYVLPDEALMAAIARGHLWTAEVAAEGIAGFIMAGPLGGDLFIFELNVARPFQRRGIGRALLRTVEAHARDLGCTAVSLTTDRLLPWGRGLYGSEGFTVLDSVTMTPALRQRLAEEVANGLPPEWRCAMRKVLSPQPRPR